jgi:branched-chain amino acid transport system substrate-binding protein
MVNSASSRRAFLKGIGAASVVATAGCSSGGEDPVRIGTLNPLAGPLALVGQETRRGIEFTLDQWGEEVAGREIEIIEEDTQSQPDTALERTRKLVEEDEVDGLVGLTNSAAGIAVSQYLREQGQVPLIASQVSTTQARENPDFCNRFYFFPWPSFRQMNIANVEFITNVLPDEEDVDTSRAHFVGSDFEAGQAARDIFIELFDGEVTTTMPPQGEADYTPFLPEVANSEADIVTGFMPSQDGIRFVTQAAEAGLPDEKAMCFLGDTTSPLPVAQQGEAANGWYGTHWWDETRDTELNNAFKQWYSENYELPPNDLAANGYSQLHPLLSAIEETGSTSTDDIIDTLEGFSYDSPMGELTFRESDHQTEANFFGYRIEERRRVPLEQYPDVIGEAFCDV